MVPAVHDRAHPLAVRPSCCVLRSHLPTGPWVRQSLSQRVCLTVYLRQSWFERVFPTKYVRQYMFDSVCPNVFLTESVGQNLSDRICLTESVRQNLSNRVCPTESVRQSLSNRVCPTESVKQNLSNRVCPTESVQQNLSNRPLCCASLVLPQSHQQEEEPGGPAGLPLYSLPLYSLPVVSHILPVLPPLPGLPAGGPQLSDVSRDSRPRQVQQAPSQSLTAPCSRITVDDLTCSVEALGEAEQPPARHR